MNFYQANIVLGLLCLLFVVAPASVLAITVSSARKQSTAASAQKNLKSLLEPLSLYRRHHRHGHSHRHFGNADADADADAEGETEAESAA